MNKLVSVILPVYNEEKYIGEAIDSILNQTYKNLELIIIDDGSTDHTLEVVMERKNKDDRVVVITRRNKGLVSSLNEGILISHGEYIARMDADDISHKDRLEKQINYLETHKEVYLLGTNYDLLFEDSLDEGIKKAAQGTHKRSMAHIDKDKWFLSINETMKFIHPTIMMRKSLFDEIGLYREYKLEDIELYFRCGVNNKRVDKLDEVLLDYRVRAASKSRTDTREEQTREIMEYKLQYLIETIFDKEKAYQYMIWGADISGNIAISVIEEMLPQAQFMGYIDSFREGFLNGYQVVKPECLGQYELDYIFICTNGGAVAAREYLQSIKKVEVKEYFKIS